MMSGSHQLDISCLAKPQHNQVYLLSKGEQDARREIPATKDQNWGFQQDF